MLLSASRDVPTGDEPAHLGAGIAYTKLHDLRFDADNAPLTKLIATLPFRFTHLNVPADAPERAHLSDPAQDGQNLDRHFGLRILYGSGNNAGHVLWLARLPMIVLTLAFALAVFGFARDLFGSAGGILALAAVTLNPSIIAHGRLINTDVAPAGFILVTTWFLWKARSRPAWFVGAGVAYGLALASKSTALLMLPPCLLLILVAALGRERHGGTDEPAGTRDVTARAGAMNAIKGGFVFLAAAVALVWLVYLVADPHLRFDRPYARADNATGALATLAAHLPLPAQYRVGVLTKISDDQIERPAFLVNHLYRGGRAIFYPAVLAIKTPPGLLVLWAITAGAIAAMRRRGELLSYLLVPPLFFFAVALFSHINIGIRHVLVVPFFMAVAAGALCKVRLSRATYVHVVTVVLLIVATGISVWRQHPSYLTYVSDVFGGPDRGYDLVFESDLDWGQDLGRLNAFLRRNYPTEHVWLVYFGVVSPQAYGFNANNSVSLLNYFSVPPPAAYESNRFNPADLANRHVAPGEVHGLVAVSAYALQLQSLVYPDLSTIGLSGPPIAQIGHSILLFRV